MGVTPSPTIRPAGLGETSSQCGHLMPEEGNGERNNPSLKYLPSLHLLGNLKLREFSKQEVVVLE